MASCCPSLLLRAQAAKLTHRPQRCLCCGLFPVTLWRHPEAVLLCFSIICNVTFVCFYTEFPRGPRAPHGQGRPLVRR